MKMEIVIGAGCFLILAFGLGWQLALAEKYNESEIGIIDLDNFGKNFGSKRMRIPAIFATMSFTLIILYAIGLIVWNIFIGIDPKATNTVGPDFKILLFLAILAVVIVIKSFYAPVLLSATLSWTLYMWYQYDIFDVIPVYSFVIDFLLNWAPPWIKNSYTIGMISYLTGSSIVATFSPG